MMDQLDRIEKKLDDMTTHLHETREGLVEAQQDIKWLQGSIKFGLSAIITIVGGAIGWLLSLLHR